VGWRASLLYPARAQSLLSQLQKYMVGISKESVSFSWRKTNITIHKRLFPATQMELQSFRDKICCDKHLHCSVTDELRYRRCIISILVASLQNIRKETKLYYQHSKRPITYFIEFPLFKKSTKLHYLSSCHKTILNVTFLLTC
jgi:hypothetical protein